MKIDQAQYRELEAFSKFGGDMDSVTEMVIDKGRKKRSVIDSAPACTDARWRKSCRDLLRYTRVVA